MQISIVGLDIAKQVFQVHAADAEGRRVAQVRLRRAQVLDFFRELPPCLVGMEACATAHHWARELIALGHEVIGPWKHLISPSACSWPSSRRLSCNCHTRPRRRIRGGEGFERGFEDRIETLPVAGRRIGRALMLDAS